MRRFAFILSGLFFLPIFVLAYSDDTTHPALTQEIVKFFNQSFPDRAIKNADAELVIQGSIDEDSGIRWMHHFYDPVHQRGLVLGKQWMSSKEWSQNTMAQAGINHRVMAGTLKSYFGGEDDYSWERAIYEYAWEDKKRGLLTLGHVLHLLEDATVPDHTRNDPHPPILDMGSPYEHWTKKFNRSTIEVTGLNNLKPVNLSSINVYFEKIAQYSNNNFFSKDTILHQDYNAPTIEYYKNGFGLKQDEQRIEYPLVQKIEKFDGTTEYTLVDAKKRILTDYWNRLSKQAVVYGAGAVKLFFDEVEKEKQTKALYDKNRSWLMKKVDDFKKGTFGIAAGLYGSSVRLEDLEDTGEPGRNEPQAAAVVQAAQAPETPTAAVEPEENSDPVLTENEESPPSAPAPRAAFVTPPRQEPAIPAPAIIKVQTPTPNQTALISRPFAPSDTSSFVPFAGGGGESRASETAARRQAEEQQRTAQQSSAPATQQQSPAADTTPPDPPVIASPSNNQALTTATALFTGTAEASSTISANFSPATTSVSSVGAWSLALAGFTQGTTTILFSATDAAGNTSTTTPITIFVNSAAPDITISIRECDQSFSQEGCLIAAQTLTIEWSSTAADIASYTIECEMAGSACPNFSFSKTTATSTTYIAPNDDTIYTFRARAIDLAGNQSTQQSLAIEIATRPVVINEIAWAGTSASRSADEWIELHNPTSKIVSLAGMRLYSQTDGKPDLTLSGAIAPAGYYLVERTDDATISDIPAGMTASFGSGSGAGLSNSGEVLALEYRGGVLDRTPPVSACGGWCGGSASGQFLTMERYDPLASGENTTNWGHFGLFLGNGKNADNAAINGTPAKRNSINYLIDTSQSVLNQEKTLKKSSSPYLVTTTLTIPAGRTLTIEPGVVVKFKDAGAGLLVQGILDARGTAVEPIIFTSFKDDSVAGDMNQDGSASSPQPGDWQMVKITGSGSVLDNVAIRYAGRYDPVASIWANLRVENASTTVRNSTIEYSGAYGVLYKNASGIFEASTVRSNTAFETVDSTGMVVDGGNLRIASNTFSANYIGLFTTASGAEPHALDISGNTFTQNKSFAMRIVGAYPSLSGNAASGNGVNGINWQGTIRQNYTLAADLPYVIQQTTLTVASGTTLTINPGTIIKLQGTGEMTINGTLRAQGTAAQQIVFTSLHDDEYGGDTNGTTTQPAAGDWKSVTLGAGSSDSLLEHAVIRYGGPKSPVATEFGRVLGALRIDGASPAIVQVLVEKNYTMGIYAKNTDFRLTDSLVQNHQDPPAPEQSYGLFITGSSTPAIQNTAFKNNHTGIAAGANTVLIQANGGITFEGNASNTTPANLIE